MALLLLQHAALFVMCFAFGLAVAAILPRRLMTLVRRVTRSRSAPWTLPVSVGILASLLASGISFLRLPVPQVHDEFSYLLAADTFASGRLTNPPHPMWPYFETFHVLQQPSYASKYPPAQGALLALGKVVAGSPTVALWLGMGLAAAAVTWALRGWMPSRWSLLGGLLVALHGNLHVLWGQTYWGGNVAFIGGALLMGAYPRLVRHGHFRDACWLGIGLMILANSRPYEGLAVSLPVAGAILSRYFGPRRPPWAATFRMASALGLTLGITSFGMAYYNARITGQAGTLPYMAYERMYSQTPLFLWQQPRPAVAHRNNIMRHFCSTFERAAFARQRTPSGYLKSKLHFLLIAWHYLLGISWTLALIFASDLLVRRRWRLPIAMVLMSLLAVAGTTWSNTNYLAPTVAPLVLAVVLGIRRLRVLTWRRPARRSTVARGLVLSHVPAFILFVSVYLAGPASEFALTRARILDDLGRTSGQHLVLVRYHPDHDVRCEWVYNDADIDAARVVWGRSFGGDADRRLREYFGDRRIWLLEADETPPRIRPYPSVARPESAHVAPREGNRTTRRGAADGAGCMHELEHSAYCATSPQRTDASLQRQAKRASSRD